MRIGTLKESYVADAALFDSRTQHAWLAIAAVLLVLFPFIASDYWLYLACLVAINVASSTGLNILTGYTGLVSLGQAAFMGLGAYTVAILQTRYGTPMLISAETYAGLTEEKKATFRCVEKVRVKGRDKPVEVTAGARSEVSVEPPRLPSAAPEKARRPPTRPSDADMTPLPPPQPEDDGVTGDDDEKVP